MSALPVMKLNSFIQKILQMGNNYPIPNSQTGYTTNSTAREEERRGSEKEAGTREEE